MIEGLNDDEAGYQTEHTAHWRTPQSRNGSGETVPAGEAVVQTGRLLRNRPMIEALNNDEAGYQTEHTAHWRTLQTRGQFRGNRPMMEALNNNEAGYQIEHTAHWGTLQSRGQFRSNRPRARRTMNKTAIKNFAIWARKQLIGAVSQKAFEYEITEGGANDPGLEAVAGRPLTQTEKQQRTQLIVEIKARGYDAVMEEAAYTWFNRFIALRFMEVNGYLPSKVRVFTDESGEFKPEILKQALEIDLEGLDRERVLSYLDVQDNEGLYRYLLITQCNALNEALPYMFEKISNWTELLFPANLLSPDSVLAHMVTDIPEEDWADQVQIIGWLYQYYISEKHDEVVDPLHGKIIKKEDIPAATQLFTPDWIVRYILDNSLGRYWIERYPESELKDKLTYFITPKDGKIQQVNESITPEELTVFDPCVGSGHFLSYAFDILMEIYKESGWSERDAARSIIENNLYGLDIDERAAQLACFSVMMKARKYNRRILNADITLNVMALQESVSMTDEMIYSVASGNSSLEKGLSEIQKAFIHAKELGSIIIPPQLDYEELGSLLTQYIKQVPDDFVGLHIYQENVKTILPLIRQAKILANKYKTVATNPPYLNRYSPILKKYIESYYSDYKGDLFSVFIHRNLVFCDTSSYSGMMTPMVWMFIKTYEPLRNEVIREKSITSLIQFEYSAFEEATVPICSFVLKNCEETTPGLYIRLSDFKGGMDVQRKKTVEAIANTECGYYYETKAENFSKIPGSPIAYWVGEAMLKSFENPTLGDLAEPRQGLATADNNRFLRLWFECVQNRICYNAKSTEEAQQSGKKWFPYNKGGDFRKWYGNNDYVVNWENDGYEIKHIVDDNGKLRSRPQNTNYYFRECATWSLNNSTATAFRHKSSGFIFDVNGMSLFSSNYLNYFIGFCNTNISYEILKFINPSISFQAGDIAKLPIIINDENKEGVEQLVQQNITLSQTDWDSFETSWDFKKHPLI